MHHDRSSFLFRIFYFIRICYWKYRAYEGDRWEMPSYRWYDAILLGLGTVPALPASFGAVANSSTGVACRSFLQAPVLLFQRLLGLMCRRQKAPRQLQTVHVALVEGTQNGWGRTCWRQGPSIPLPQRKGGAIVSETQSNLFVSILLAIQVRRSWSSSTCFEFSNITSK